VTDNLGPSSHIGRLTWKCVGFEPQNHSGHHADAADIEDPEAREEITNPQVAYVRCCLRLGLQYHQSNYIFFSLVT
jgi:hypothetical protein